MRVTAPNKLDPAEVEKMCKQAEEFAESDRTRKEEAETINQADTLVYTAENQLKDFEGKVDEKEVKDIKEKIAELKSLLSASTRDIATIKKKLDECNHLLHKAATELYQKAAKAKSNPDDVVDAEKA